MDLVVIAGLALPAAVLYTAPALIAHHRRLPRTRTVIVMNLFLGWTVAGWATALAMAIRQGRPPSGDACPAARAAGEPAWDAPGAPRITIWQSLN